MSNYFSRRRLHSNGAFIVLQLALLYLGTQANSTTVWRWVLFATIPISLWSWIQARRRFQLIDDVPLSRIASAAQGYVELQGVALKPSENPLCSYLTGLPCLWYRYQIEERNNNNKGWHTVDEGESDACFEIRDETGRCVIDPEHAEVVTTHTQTWVKSGQRFTEHLLLANDAIYALGELTTLHNSSSPLSLKEDVGHLITEWKKNPSYLISRFDQNRDGVIDLEEWEKARTEANKEIIMQHRELRVQEGDHVLRRPKDGRAYLISNKPPESLARVYLLWSWAHLGVFFLAVGIAAKSLF